MIVGVFKCVIGMLLNANGSIQVWHTTISKKFKNKTKTLHVKYEYN